MVLEVGLGGRLDAINIIDADVALLCPSAWIIGEWLGRRWSRSGRRRPGCFAADRTWCSAVPLCPGACGVRLQELQCQVLTREREFRWRITAMARRRTLGLSLARCGATGFAGARRFSGAVQYRNAASALTALQLLGGRGPAISARRRRPARRQRCRGAFRSCRAKLSGSWTWLTTSRPRRCWRSALAARPRGPHLRSRGHARRQGRGRDRARTRPLIDHWLLAGIDDEPRGLSAAALQARLPPLRGSSRARVQREAACAARARAGASAGIASSCSVRSIWSGRRLRGLGYTEADRNGKPSQRTTDRRGDPGGIDRAARAGDISWAARNVAASTGSSGEGPPVRSYTIDLNSRTRTGPLQSTPAGAATALPRATAARRVSRRSWRPPDRSTPDRPAIMTAPAAGRPAAQPSCATSHCCARVDRRCPGHAVAATGGHVAIAPASAMHRTGGRPPRQHADRRAAAPPRRRHRRRLAGAARAVCQARQRRAAGAQRPGQGLLGQPLEADAKGRYRVYRAASNERSAAEAYGPASRITGCPRQSSHPRGAAVSARRGRIAPFAELILAMNLVGLRC